MKYATICLFAALGAACGNDTPAADTSLDDTADPDTGSSDTTAADTTDAIPDVPADVTEDTVVDDVGPGDPAIEDVAEEELPAGTLLGDARITFYWVAYEGDHECTTADTQLGTCAGDPIATVCSSFAEAARLEGTARLLDGRMINIGGCSCSGGYDCFVVLDTTEYPWGMGNRSNPLVPFVSIATDTSVIPGETVLYCPQLDGVALPADEGGGTHDGCVRADDVGGGISGMHIDFFAALRDYYLELDPQIPENVTLYTDSPRCGP